MQENGTTIDEIQGIEEPTADYDDDNDDDDIDETTNENSINVKMLATHLDKTLTLRTSNTEE